MCSAWSFRFADWDALSTGEKEMKEKGKVCEDNHYTVYMKRLYIRSVKCNDKSVIGYNFVGIGWICPVCRKVILDG